jgi:hypothetical protein
MSELKHEQEDGAGTECATHGRWHSGWVIVLGTLVAMELLQ